MGEFKVAGIEVATRTFQTVDEEPMDAIRDLFVSLSLSPVRFQLTGLSVIIFINKAK